MVNAMMQSLTEANTNALYLLSADSLSSGAIKLNGATLKAAADGTAPQLVSAEGDGPYMDLPPRTLGFLLLPEAGAAACK